jgi:metal-sulfur cluster biosynthetic enzyme
MPQWVEVAARKVPGVKSARVNLVFDPPWTPARMSDEAKLELNML